MWVRNTAIVSLSVVLSVLAAFMVNRPIKHAASDTIQAKKIELVDDEGKVRGTFMMVPTGGGKSEPEIVLLEDNGQVGASLSLVEKGLFIGINKGNPDDRASVKLGYMGIGDVSPLKDSEKGWGLLVENKGKATLMGISNLGKPWGISVSR